MQMEIAAIKFLQPMDGLCEEGVSFETHGVLGDDT